MANKAIEEVLNDLGWSDGFRIPIANAENKRLEEEIERKTRLRSSLKAQLENARERIQDIRKHASDVRQEHNQNQRLLVAHSAQVETENQLYRLAQHNESRVNQEIKQKKRETQDAEEKIASFQQNIVKMTKKLEATKKNIQMDQERLLAWEEKLNKKEEKNLVIEQFVKSDEKMFKKIELERQSLSEKAELYRQSVIKAVGDVHELEMGLDRTARMYSQAVKDRRQLMDQWSQSVHVLSQRDKCIYDALQEIEVLREIAKERLEAYQEAERFLGIQETENKELEDETKSLDKELVYRRDEHRKLADAIESYTIELHIRMRYLQDLARQTQDARANLRRKQNDHKEKRLKIEECKRRIGDLAETLKSITGQKMNTEEQTMQLQDMLEKEEKRKATIAKEIKHKQDLILRANGQHLELEGELKVLKLRQYTESKQWDNLLIDQAKAEKTTKEKKDVVYQTNLELQKVEMRLQNMLGQAGDKAEIRSKQNRLKQLQDSFKEKTETSKTLQAQVAQVESEIRRITSLINNNSEELKKLRSKQHDIQLFIEGGEKQLKAAQASYEERRVDQNILELRLKESEKIVSKVGGKLYDLEKYSIQMEAAMQERRSEIKAQKESLNLQRRCVLADCAEVRNVILERRGRIEQLQVRYQLYVAALGTNPEDGSPMSATYIKIQSAQERYLLQERGDGLDRAIRKAEAEIRSMENTLKLVNVCNSKYKSSLSLVDDHGPEKSEQRRLDEELYNALELARRRRQALERLEEDYKRMELNHEQLMKDMERLREEREQKSLLVMNLEQQISEQMEKILRADKNLRKLLKDIQNKCICVPDETILLQERDIAVRELQEQNTLALQRIAEFTIRHLEAEAYVKKLLAEKNINLPSTYYLRQQATPITSSRCSEIGAAPTKPAPRARSAHGGSVSNVSSISLAGSYISLEPYLSGSDSAKSPKTSFQPRTLKKK